MSTFLKVVGALWALIGVGNIAFMNWSSAQTTDIALSVGLIFNFIIFVFPGGSCKTSGRCAEFVAIWG
jgi:hypothetical protein